MKRFILIFVLFLSCINYVQADEILVQVKPAYSITTSKDEYIEGDRVKFVIMNNVVDNSKIIIKKGTSVYGTITSIVNNDYASIPAEMTIEDLKTVDTTGKQIKLKGFIYKKGNDHSASMEFLNPQYFRGGEVQIKPFKDIFTLILEVK